MAKKKAVGKTSKKKKKSVVKLKVGGRKKAAPAIAKHKNKAAKKVKKKKTTAKKAATKPAKATNKKKTVKKQTVKKKSRKIVKRTSLGRPRATADSRLDQVFQKDYQAREVFEFLGVHTLRELEAFAPDEIIDKLTGPLLQTVQRIRKTLAMVNRSLANDRDFALEFKKQL